MSDTYTMLNLKKMALFLHKINIIIDKSLILHFKIFQKFQHSSSGRIEDLFEDIRDGVLLCHLIEVLTGEALVSYKNINVTCLFFRTHFIYLSSYHQNHCKKLPHPLLPRRNFFIDKTALEHRKKNSN